MLSFYLTLIDEPSDKEKFTEIYEHYKGMMMQKAMSILHNSALAEEAVQESFVKIAKNIFKISSPICSKTASFIVIIVRNTSYDILRREKPDRNVSLDEEISAENIEMPDINEVLSTVGINFILEVINGMDDKYRDALSLKYLYGYSNSEIAKLIGITEKNAEMRIYRAKAILKAKYKRSNKPQGFIYPDCPKIGEIICNCCCFALQRIVPWCHKQEKEISRTCGNCCCCADFGMS